MSMSAVTPVNRLLERIRLRNQGHPSEVPESGVSCPMTVHCAYISTVAPSKSRSPSQANQAFSLLVCVKIQDRLFASQHQ